MCYIIDLRASQKKKLIDLRVGALHKIKRHCHSGPQLAASPIIQRGETSQESGKERFLRGFHFYDVWL